MLKNIALLVVVLFTASTIFAQRDGVAPLAKGEQQLNFGIGISDGGVPLFVSYDFAVHKDVTITPQIDLRFDNNNTYFGVVFKGDYHWNYLIGIPNDFDFYSGARVGMDFGNSNTDFRIGLQVGGRWYWNDRWGLNLEIAGGTGIGTVFGVSMKM